jgi:hypothetical protein
MVEFGSVTSLDLSGYRPLGLLAAHGCLGLITIGDEIFICVVSGTTKVADIRPGETAQKIFAVEFYCLNSDEYDEIERDYDPRTDPYGAQSLTRKEPMPELPFADLKKLLSDGSFYYSTDCDLTNRMQDR